MTSDTVRAFWYNGSNVGDLLTPFILDRLLDKHVEWADKGIKWLVAGSVLDRAQPGDILCGVGSFERITAVPGTQTRNLLVRGPLTAGQLGITCSVYGDAGLLLPGVYNPVAPAITNDWGIVAHYVDEEYAKQLTLPKGCRLISVTLSVREFIAAVRSCRRIASSSLHGVIVAEAYGVPAVRVKFPGTYGLVRDFEYKHRDYYLGTGRDLPECLELTAALSGKPVRCTTVQDHARKVYAHVRTGLMDGGFEL
jgi:pyruvyltransferase